MCHRWQFGFHVGVQCKSPSDTLSLFFKNTWRKWMHLSEAHLVPGAVFWNDCIRRRTSRHPTALFSESRVVQSLALAKLGSQWTFLSKNTEAKWNAQNGFQLGQSLKEFYRGNSQAISVTETASKKFATALRLGWPETLELSSFLATLPKQCSCNWVKWIVGWVGYW